MTRNNEYSVSSIMFYSSNRSEFKPFPCTVHWYPIKLACGLKVNTIHWLD